MSVEHAAPGRLMEFKETNELDWDALYVHQAPRIFNYFRFRLGSECDVEELTARTFEHAWRSRSRYRRDLAGFSTWLFSIAQNIGTDHLRARREHLPIDAAPCVNSLVLVDNFANVKRLEKVIAALDVGTPYVPHPCDGEPAHPPANAAAHP